MQETEELTRKFLETLLRVEHTLHSFPPPGELSKGEFFVLQHLGCRVRQKSSITPTEISETMAVSKPAISKVLNVLEDKGCIRRMSYPSDRRAVEVVLTDKGKRVREESMKVVRESVAKIVDEMGEEAMNQLIQSLETLLQAVGRCYPRNKVLREEKS